jgi:predicted NBD/HSP70 family sugar kinase
MSVPIVKASLPTKSVGGSPHLLRQLNAAAVLRVIRDGGPVTRPEIARHTGLSKPTVKFVVEALLADGYIRESAPDNDAHPRRPGPRAKVLRFRSDLGHVLGLDIGANKILALVTDLEGRIIASERRHCLDARDVEAVLAATCQIARRALHRAGVPVDELSAVAVGTPGIVELSSGRITLAPQLPGWENLPLASRLAESLGQPVLADNEVHLALLAERWRGAMQGIDNALFVHIGVGIGCGILIEGQLYRGATGAAGEIGYLPIVDDDEKPPGGMGPFEHAAGGGAFARLGQRAAAGPVGALLRDLAAGDPGAVSAEIVFAAAARGDVSAQAVVDKLVGRLARGIAAATVLLDPAIIVVGGGVSKAGEALLAPLERAVTDLVPVVPQFAISTLGDTAGALGAVKVALEAADASLFAFATEAS